MASSDEQSAWNWRKIGLDNRTSLFLRFAEKAGLKIAPNTLLEIEQDEAKFYKRRGGQAMIGVFSAQDIEEVPPPPLTFLTS
jgi:hypothetical protein